MWIDRNHEERVFRSARPIKKRGNTILENNEYCGLFDAEQDAKIELNILADTEQELVKAIKILGRKFKFVRKPGFKKADVAEKESDHEATGTV